MSYCTVADVRGALDPDGDPSDPTSAAGQSDAALTAHIAEAQAEVDARLAARATMPLATVPTLVANITRDIAAYLAMLTYRKGDPIPQGDTVAARYARAQQLLAGLQSGEIPLDIATAPAEQAVSQDTVVNAYDGALFQQSELGLVPTTGGGYGQDPWNHRSGQWI